MKIIEKLNVRLLEPTMTDEQLETALSALNEKKVPRVTLLPSQLARGVQLMAQSEMQVGSVVDFPLAAGTQGKLFYELGQYFQLGADFLEVSLPPKQLIEAPDEVAELIKQLQNIATIWGEVIFQVDIALLTVEEKMTAFSYFQSQAASFSLGHQLSEKQRDLAISVWNLGGYQDIELQLNISQPTTEQVKLLLKDGISRVGVCEWEQLDLAEEVLLH